MCFFGALKPVQKGLEAVAAGGMDPGRRQLAEIGALEGAGDLVRLLKGLYRVP